MRPSTFCMTRSAYRRGVTGTVTRESLTSTVRVDEGEDLADRFLQHIRGHAANAPCLSDAPVQALDLVGKDRSLNAKPLRQQHLNG